MNFCGNCNYARQIGDKKRTDVVGCVHHTVNDTWRSGGITNTHIYEGYFYGQRRPGDTKEYDDPRVVGRGVLHLGILVESKGYCPKHEERSDMKQKEERR